MAAQIIDKATGKTQQVSQDVIDLDSPSIVKLEVSSADVAGMERQGRDLVIRLKSGEVIRIADYYDHGTLAEQSDVVFQERDGRLWGVNHDGSFRLYEINDLSEILGTTAAGDEGGGAVGLLAPVLGLLGGAGLIAVASGGGGGSSGGEGDGPDALGLALAADSGVSATDKITNAGRLVVSGVETGATYEYSTDGGATWQRGGGTGFELGEGTYAEVKVRQRDAAGNVSPETSLGPVIVDATIAPPVVALASDTGVSGDGVTSDGTVNVTGLEAGATYEYSLDGGLNWVPGSGTSFELAAGTYTGVQVRQTDVAGNVSTPGLLGTVTVVTGPADDLTLSLENDTGVSAVDGVTSDGTVLVEGLAAGATYEYSTDSGASWTPGSGTSFELAEGVYGDVQVRQVDSAGSIGLPTSLGAVTVDLAAAAPGAALASDTGASPSDGVTSDGTVNVTGLEAGATYKYSLDGGLNWVPGSGTSFELAAGTYTGVQVRQTDVAGNVSTPGLLGTVTVVTGPADDLTLSLENDTGVSAVDGVTSDGTVLVAGMAAGATYEYSTDGGTSWTPGSGTSFELAPGTYTGVQVRQIDAAGSITQAIPLGAITIDTTVAQPEVALASDTGASGDGVTSDGTVIVTGLETGATYEYSLDGGTSWVPGSGTSFELATGTYTGVQVRQTDVAGNVSAPGLLGTVSVVTEPPGDLTPSLENDTGISAIDGVTSDGTVLVAGLAAGATYEYSLDGGLNWNAGSGTSFELAEGVYGDVQVRQVDSTGSTGLSTSLGAVTVDATAPGALAATLVSDTGVSGTDRITNDATIAVGNLEAGASWQYSLDGGATWVAGTGTSFELANGIYSGVQVRQTDVAGNLSTVTPIAPFTVDTTIAPLSAVLANDTGASDVDSITTDGTIVIGDLEADATWQYRTDAGAIWQAGTGDRFVLPEGSYADVQVRQTDVAGNVSSVTSLGAVTVDNSVPGPLNVALINDTGISPTDQITSDGRVTVGGLESGAGFEYSVDRGATWQLGTGDSFTLLEGTYPDVRVRQIDPAGNRGGEAILTGTQVDVSVAAPTAALAADTGISGSDGITANGAVTVTGVEAGAQLQYSLDGGETWIDGTGSGFTLAPGSYLGVQVRQVDIAGNISNAAQLGTITVDTAVAPVTLALASDTGSSPTDLVTSDGTVRVGNLEAGATWEFSVDNSGIWQPGTGTSFELGAGTYSSVQVRQTDVAGNLSLETSLGPITIETSAGDLTAVLENDIGASATDGITSDGTVLVDAIAPGAGFEYSIDRGLTWQPGVGSSFELAPGSYEDVQVRQVDGAGNTGLPTSLGAVIVDVTPPGELTPSLTNDTGPSATDRITSNGAVVLNGIETGARFEYSLDDGGTWLAGTGTGFTLAAGTYTDVRVRQVDAAGNVGAFSSLGAVTVDAAVALPVAGLVADTGLSATDRITADGTVTVGNLEAGATYEYSLNGGAGWIAGSGTSFELADGAYSNVQVRQIDLAGNVSEAVPLGAVTVDTLVATPTVRLFADTGASPNDRLTNDATVTVGAIEPGASWQYSLDGGVNWLSGSGTGFELADGFYAGVQVRQIDVAGNVSATAGLAPVTVDTTVPSLTLALVTDTGTSATDRVTSDGTLTIGNLEANASWQYSTNAGLSWINGTGTTFELAEGVYTGVQVRQTDRAGNVSEITSIGAVTIDFPVAVDDVATLDLGAQTSVVGPRITDSSVTVVGLLESDVGADESVTITVPADRTGSVRIEVGQTALAAVADAFRVDLIDAEGNVVYSAVTENSLVGDVAGLDLLGLTSDNQLVAVVEGLPPGEYRVVVRNDESDLEQLLDTDGGGVSLTELGQAGVVLGAGNQTLVLDAVEQALGGGVLGGTARGLLATTLGLTADLGAGGLVGILTSLLNNPLINAPQLLDTVLDSVADALLSNTLSLLQTTTVTTQVVEYEYANEVLSGNALSGNTAGGLDDLGGGAVITQVANSDGETIALAVSGSTSIAGEYGVLTIAGDGAYSYEAYGNPNSINRSDVFTYTLSDGVTSDTATITIGLQGIVVSARGDAASSTVNWSNVVDSNFYNASGTIVGGILGTSGYESSSFVIGNNQAVSGFVSLQSTVSALGSGALIVEELVNGNWSSVRSVPYSFLANVLGEVARIDLAGLNLDAGTYRTRATLSGVSVVTVNTDVDVTYLDQFTNTGSTSATGNLLTNDVTGSLLTDLEVFNPDTSGYVDVNEGVPLTVNGQYGSLTVNADGSYLYNPFASQSYFNTPRVDTFEYQLVHPSEAVSQSTLTVTLQPSGAGVSAVQQASAQLSDSVDIDSLLASAGEPIVVAAHNNEQTGSAPYDLMEDQGTIDSVLEEYLNGAQNDEHFGANSVMSTDNDIADMSIAAQPQADPLGYLVLHPDIVNVDHWQNHSMV